MSSEEKPGGERGIEAQMEFGSDTADASNDVGPSSDRNLSLPPDRVAGTCTAINVTGTSRGRVTTL